jgi:hypothetical protein
MLKPRVIIHAINSSQRMGRLKLIGIYGNIDRERALQEKESFKHIFSFYTILIQRLMRKKPLNNGF